MFLAFIGANYKRQEAGREVYFCFVFCKHIDYDKKG